MRTPRRIAAAILLTAASSGAAVAQEVHAGLIAGPMLSQVTYDDPTNLIDPRLGITAGFFMVIGAGGHFAVQPELMLSQKGAVVPAVGGIDDEIEATFDLTYIEVPVLARFAHPLWIGRAFALVGPVAGYRSSAKISADGYQSLNLGTTTAKFDVGAALGAGMEFDVDGGSVQVSLRLSQGFIDVEDAPGAVPGKNRTLSLVVGFARVYGRY
ncbi:MAG TPA: porin family protein [Longimicrobiales bacterium]